MLARFAVALAVTAALATPRQVDAFHPDTDVVGERPATAEGIELRTHREVSWDLAPPRSRPAWRAFLDATPGSWRASWDTATGVPSRILGAGISAPGAVRSARAAEEAARRALREHIDLLAPGAEPTDFDVVSNELDGDLRVVGLAQRHDGLPVVGGQVSFRFRNDRLFVIGSEALPHVRVETTGPLLPDSAARRAAAEISLARAPEAGEVLAGEVEGPVILPLVGERRVAGYRLAMGVDIEGSIPGQRWQVYVDAATGEFLAREQRAHPTTATLHFDTPVRHPGGERDVYPARRALVDINGRTAETTDDGVVVWFGEGDTAQLILRPEGTFVALHNAAGSLAEIATTLTPGASFIWDSDNEIIDAQLTAFIHTQVAADRARAVTSFEDWLEDEVEVHVNIDNTCNAYFDQTSKSINFFRRSEDCANTARLPDVVYHEFGHLLHVQSIQPGVGQFDGAFSEGASDYFAATITGDPGVGRGFFHDREPLRHIFPSGEPPRRWPDDISGIHTTGLIFAGAMWRLRRELVETHGTREGHAIADELYYAALKRATDIPSTYVEILVEDDTDGDLSTGTPNICEINRAFGPHGLRVLQSEIEDLGYEPVSDEGHRVAFEVHGIYDRCEGDRIESADLVWRVRGDDEEHRVAMAGNDRGFSGVIPPQPRDTSIRYRFEIEFADDGLLRLPQNPADPELDLYVGELVPLYCTDFEDQHPFRGGGWVRGALHGMNDWEWGPPHGQAGDPDFAYVGDNVIGNDLGGLESDGAYARDSINFVRSPIIEVGDLTNVRLQYRRWLTVADGHFDTAMILANGVPVWTNADSDQGLQSRVHHRDEMWRFHDVPLVPVLNSDTVRVTFRLESNGNFDLGGWNIDSFCIVADPDSVCGDGEVTGFETCDDGEDNSDTRPDACRTNCRPAYCGDGVVNSGEECDPAAGDDVPCTDTCRIRNTPSSCHCRAGASGGPLAGPLLVALLGALAWSRLRRRRAA